MSVVDPVKEIAPFSPTDAPQVFPDGVMAPTRDATMVPSARVSSSEGVFNGRYARRYRKLTSSRTIQYVVKKQIFFENIPDIGMDRFLVSRGDLLGTSGLASCFAVCSIGKTYLKTPVLGLCHVTCLSMGFRPFETILQFLKDEMIKEEAEEKTIKTYVVGGQAQSEIEPEGTIPEEEQILATPFSKKVRGVLFNMTQADDEEDSLNVVLTPRKVYVSKNPLFAVSGQESGMKLFDRK